MSNEDEEHGEDFTKWLVSLSSEKEHADFSGWLAGLLDQDESAVRDLLKDQTALHFLITWSLFEAKCFGGRCSGIKVEQFPESVECTAPVDREKIRAPAQHFHERYRDKVHYSHLMHDHASRRMDAVLKRSFPELTESDLLFIVALVAFRFRNNIFHGNKGVASWLRFQPQIKLCIMSMQHLTSHAEQVNPTMKTAGRTR